MKTVILFPITVTILEKLTSKHFLFFIVPIVMMSIQAYTSLFIRESRTDTWICTIAAALIFLIFIFYIFNICEKTNGYDFKDVILKALGKPLGNAYIFLFGLALILSIIESAIIESGSIHHTFFLETPTWYLILFFILPAIYCINKPLDTIIIVVLVFVPLIILTETTLEILVHKYKDFRYLFPVLQFGVTKQMILSTLKQIGSLSNFILLFPLLYKISDKTNIKKRSIITLSLVCLSLIFLMIGTISFFGTTRASNIYFTRFLKSQRIYYGGFIENGEAHALLQVVLGWFLKYIICFSVLLDVFKEKIKNRKIFIIALTTIIFIFSYFLSSSIFRLFEFLKYFQYFNFIVLFIFPLIIYTIYSIKYKKNKSNFPSPN